MNTSQLNEVRTKMQGSLDFFQQELSSIRTGRASSTLLENVIVSAYESTQKLKIREMGNINVVDARTIAVEPWDVTTVSDIVKAISDSLQLSAQVNENVIRVVLPPLTEERRKEFIKILNQKAEMSKVAIRQIRGDYMHDLKKGEERKEITEDERERGEKEIQKMTDEFVEKIENVQKKKEEELLTL
jgi:ribosome recycling factor